MDLHFFADKNFGQKLHTFYSIAILGTDGMTYKLHTIQILILQFGQKWV